MCVCVCVLGGALFFASDWRAAGAFGVTPDRKLSDGCSDFWERPNGGSSGRSNARGREELRNGNKVAQRTGVVCGRAQERRREKKRSSSVALACRNWKPQRSKSFGGGMGGAWMLSGRKRTCGGSGSVHGIRVPLGGSGHVIGGGTVTAYGGAFVGAGLCRPPVLGSRRETVARLPHARLAITSVKPHTASLAGTRVEVTFTWQQHQRSPDSAVGRGYSVQRRPSDPPSPARLPAR